MLKQLSFFLLALFLSIPSHGYVLRRDLAWKNGSTIILALAQEEKQENIQRFAEAISYWSVLSGLKFVFITDTSYSGEFHRLVFLSRPESDEYRDVRGFVGGRAHQGKTKLSNNRLTPMYFLSQQTDAWGRLLLSTIVHEFGHVLGLDHEFEHPKFPEVFNFDLYALDKNIHCPRYYVISGNTHECVEKLPINEENKKEYFISDRPDVRSNMSYPYSFRYYMNFSGKRTNVSVPSEVDMQAMLDIYPPSTGNLGTYHDFLINATKRNGCGRASEIYRPQDSKNPCPGKVGFGFKNGRDKECYDDLLDAYDRYLSVCLDNTDGNIPPVLGSMNKDHTIFSISSGKIESSWEHAQEPLALERILKAQKIFER